MKTTEKRAALMISGGFTRADCASALESYMALPSPGCSLKGCKFDENLLPSELVDVDGKMMSF